MPVPPRAPDERVKEAGDRLQAAADALLGDDDRDGLVLVVDRGVLDAMAIHLRRTQ